MCEGVVRAYMETGLNEGYLIGTMRNAPSCVFGMQPEVQVRPGLLDILLKISTWILILLIRKPLFWRCPLVYLSRWATALTASQERTTP